MGVSPRLRRVLSLMAGKLQIAYPADLEALVAALGQRGAARQVGCSRSAIQHELRRRAGGPRLQMVGADEPHELSDELPVIERDYRDREHLYLYPMGDVHLGADKHKNNIFEEWIGYLVAHDDCSMLGTGDFFNSAIVGSKSDVYSEQFPLQRGKRILRDQLKPLADEGRLDGLCPGNHEARIWRAVGDCPVNDVAGFLGVPYFKAAALFVYHVGTQTYEVYVRHGTGNGQSLAALPKGAMVAQADVYVTGHTHKLAVTADEFFVREGDRTVRRRRYYVSSGSFLAYEEYAAERGYVPTRLGAPRIYLDGQRHDVHASI